MVLSESFRVLILVLSEADECQELRQQLDRGYDVASSTMVSSHLAVSLSN